MGKSDALSRRADHGTGSNDNSDIVPFTPGLFAIRALEGLQVTGEEWDLLRDIRKGTREGDQEDTITKVVKELKNTRSHTVQTSEWKLEQNLLYFRGKIYVFWSTLTFTDV